MTAQTAPTDTASLLETFADPPAAYRPAPFLVLNDEYEEAAGEARITEVLEGYKRIGYGGAFLHPRPGLITEYLSPRWFEIVRHAIGECKRLGLVPYLYDENSYPSGVGGGHVPARAPEARTRFVAPAFGTGPAGIPGKTVALHRWADGQPGEMVERDAIGPDDAWLAFVLGDMPPSPWHGETATPSLLDPHTARAFIESTHEAYRRELGDLWPDVPAIFTDEPHLPAQGHGPWGTGLHITPWVYGEFVRRRGYDLLPHLVSLVFDVGDYRQVRFDLYETMHELWVENWARPLEAWCEDNGIALTGHYLEHDWPSPYSTPGHVHMLAHMQWPGSDMLEGFLLSGHDYPDIQNFYPVPDGQEPHGLYYLRQVHAVCNQLGKARNIDECWGAGGHDSTPADWLRIGRWLVVHGVNLLNPHLSFTTIRGTRKADHPQTFSDHSPWYEHTRPLNDELSRLAWIANGGAIEQRVLLLDPLTTGYCVSRKGDALPPELQGGSAHSASAPPLEGNHQQPLASVLHIQHEVGELGQGLSDAQVDFDPGDEYVLEEFGAVEGDRIAIGRQRYELLVWPGCLTNLRSATAAMLREYLANGGRIAGVRPEAVTIDGRESDFLAEIDDACTWVADREALVAAVREMVPPRLAVETPPRTGLAHMRRVIDCGEAFVVVSSSGEAIESAVTIATERRTVIGLDPATGEAYALPVERVDGGLRTALRVNPRGATVLLATDAAASESVGAVPAAVAADTFPVRAQAAVSARGDETPDGSPVAGEDSSQARNDKTGGALSSDGDMRPKPVSIERGAENVLVLDTCELTVSNRTFPRMERYAANAHLWRTHGFETNGWFAVIQYRDQIVSRNRDYGPDSGGSVTYRFEIAEGVDTSDIRLAIELPELWQVAVNGQAVFFDYAERWLDVHIGAVPVGHLLGPGENAVTLTGIPFDVRREVDQIYLLGSFGVEATDPGFRIVPPQPLGLGPWRDQGMPFFDREVAYRFALPADGPGVMAFGDDEWHGSYLVIEQGGEIVARLAESPFRVGLDPAHGRDVTVRVIGLPKNLLGPFHAPGRPRKRAWTPMWWGNGVPTEPQPGGAYDLIDLGLFAAPVWHEG